MLSINRFECIKEIIAAVIAKYYSNNT